MQWSSKIETQEAVDARNLSKEWTAEGAQQAWQHLWREMDMMGQDPFQSDVDLLHKKTAWIIDHNRN